MFGISIFLAAAASQQARGWAPCPSFELSGVERLVNGADRPFLVRRSGETTLTETTRAIDGYLAGIPRRELRTPTGFLTWLPTRPHWILRRMESSLPDYESMMVPRNFDPSDIVRGPIALERILGKHVLIGRAQTIAGRPCYPLRISDRSAASQNWWVDQATGFLLKSQETVADQIFAEREFTEFKPGAKVDSASLAAPADAKTIVGVVSAGVLERVDTPRTDKQCQDDLQLARKGTILGEGRWIMRLPPVEGFDYMLSELRETRGQLPPPNKGAAAPEAEGAVFVLSGDSSQVVLRTKAQDTAGGTINVTFTMIDPAKREAPILERERVAGASGVLQSDFLNRSTGDTVSFIQLRNASISASMRGVKLPAPVVTKVEGLGNVNVYRISSPFPLTVVSWKGFAGEYALASTSLGEKDLLVLAKNATNG